MITYVPITYEAIFFRHESDGQVVVIGECLPFMVPEGQISMVLEHVDGNKRNVANLVAGSIYAYESRPDEPEAQSFYDRTIAERAKAKARDAASQASEKLNISIPLAVLPDPSALKSSRACES